MPLSHQGREQEPPPLLRASARNCTARRKRQNKTHASDGQGRAQDACLDAVAATKAEENPHTKGRQLTN
jgi:hypothetical protein